MEATANDDNKCQHLRQPYNQNNQSQIVNTFEITKQKYFKVAVAPQIMKEAVTYAQVAITLP